MPRIQYKLTRFRKATMEIIETANSIIREYEAEGYDLTVRQLYYQFVARDIIPNTPEDYNKLAAITNNARLAGLIDWDSIVDRTREEKSNNHWNSPSELLEAAAKQYRIDTRSTQKYYVEVWIEKDALVGVIERVCRQNDVTFLSCRGYASQSAMWRAAQRFIEQEEEEGKDTVIIQLSDHDPSGVNMTDDIRNRMDMFGSVVETKRIALTMAQVNQYGPPPNPAKTTDSRYDAYRAQFGDDSWELDALDPRVITQLINDAIEDHTDEDLRENLVEDQTSQKRRLKKLAREWSDSDDDEEEYENED
jgi:hypothetical protein